jgi:dTDP-4-amino-4,6-dideoxygalactose transaminase
MPGPGAYWIGEEELEEVADVVRSGHLFRYGDVNDPRFRRKVLGFEELFAAYLGVRRVLATNSGTSSLFIALHAMGFQPGDEVIVPTFGFAATYHAPIFAGLVPVLAEIDDSLCLDPGDIEHRITPRTKAIIPVHMLGNPCDMNAIMAIARKYGLAVLEDACQAVGASYRGRKVGSFGQMAAFSLNVFKTITAGDGGALVTGDENLYERAFGLHDQGYKPGPAVPRIAADSILGMDFRMNELTGAVALAQLRKLDRIVAALRQRKCKLKALVDGVPGMRFRRLNDPEGECGTLCAVLFDRADRAAAVAAALGTVTAERTGYHYHSNIEHLNRHLDCLGRPHGPRAYPRSHDILCRAILLSVGVVDAGLGAGFGINIQSTDEEIQQVARQFHAACQQTAAT